MEHLEDIMINGSRFVGRWGFWPMRGWLEAFQERGLVHQVDGDWQPSIRVASVPASHVYIRHLAPTQTEDSAVRRLSDPPARRADTPTGAPWWPPKMLDPQWIRSADFDLLHVHFGFDAESVARLEEVCDALEAKGVPLVYTVHDLQNPHHVDTALHQAQLGVLIRRAAAVITLSRQAAQTIESRWGVRPHVVPHPHVVDLDLIEHYGRHSLRGDDEFRLGVHLKSLRRNMRTVEVLQAAAWAIRRVPGGVLQVNVHHDVYDYEGDRHDAALRAWLDAAEAEVEVHDYYTDAELYDYLNRLHASLLPYRFGTHSGWMEACHDLGTAVIAPDVGCYASQGADHLFRWQGETLERASLLDAVQAAAAQASRGRGADEAQAGRRRRAWRAEQRRWIAAEHERIYRSVLS